MTHQPADAAIPTEADVTAALATVQDPELHQDLVSLGMVRDVRVDEGKVSFTVVLTTPACPLRSQIEADCRAAVGSLPGVRDVEIAWDARVPRDGKLSARLDLAVRNVIAVGSGKGGVGKTTVAVNLAAALARQGASVGVLDADVYGPNVPIMMGATAAKPRSLDGKTIEPVTAHGIKLMSIGFLVDEATPLVWRGPMLHNTLRQFLADVNWGDLDYLIIDLPPGTGDVALSLTQSLPLTGAVVVTTPQAVSKADVLKSVAMFQLDSIRVPVLGIVENMSGFIAPDTQQRYDIFGRGAGREIAERMDVPFLGEVPIDPAVREAGDDGVPVVLSHPASAVGAAFVDIARQVAARISVLHLAGPPSAAFESDPDLTVS